MISDTLERMTFQLGAVRDDIWLSLIHTLMHAADMDKHQAAAIVDPLMSASRSRANGED